MVAVTLGAGPEPRGYSHFHTLWDPGSQEGGHDFVLKGKPCRETVEL